jgi:hypothetical protein
VAVAILVLLLGIDLTANQTLIDLQVGKVKSGQSVA